jgi:D-alanyl-D-alanine carboxypeptidase
MPANGLTALVTAEYGLSRAYVPPDLVSLSGYLPLTVTLGYPTQVREIVAEPLLEMINDMHVAGLKPTIISGYRSYDAQAIAWTKWQDKHPDRASIISAPPGHSEHQLGTTIDFGSPELPALVGDEEIEFHTDFYLTSEGAWLSEHAHKYGFVLSYPRETFELTGMYYEPWHYRYVGQEMAAMLQDQGMSLISYLISTQPPPCIP